MKKKRKNAAAVLLGRKGGFAGKGSAKRKAAAIKANQIRWANHTPKNKSKKVLA